MDESSGGARILVVVPDAPIRQSILFVLETEGFGVFSLENLPDSASDDSGFDCAVVDEDAIRSLPGGWKRLRGTGMPLVVLVDRLDDGAVEGARSVRKPLLGSALVEAIRTELGEGRHRPDGAAT